MRYVRAFLRLLAVGYGIGQLFVLVTIFKSFCDFFRIKGKRFLMAKLLQYHCRFILFACAVKYKGMNTKGVFSGQPALILSNHINYLDVLILAAINPLGFLAKKEVGHWGILGDLIATMSVIFVNREDMASRVKAIGELSRGISDFSYVVFPQGTTTKQTSLADSPWFSGQLFALKKAYAKSISNPRLLLVGLSYDNLEQMAWIDEMSLLSHLWQVLQKKQTRAYVVMVEYRLKADDLSDLRTLSEKIKNCIEKQFILAQSALERNDSGLPNRTFATENSLQLPSMLKP